MKLETLAANGAVVRTRTFPTAPRFRTYVVTPDSDGHSSLFVAGVDREDRVQAQHDYWVKKVNDDALDDPEVVTSKHDISLDGAGVDPFGFRKHVAQ